MIKGEIHIYSLREDPGRLGPTLDCFIPGWNKFINNYIIEYSQGRIHWYRPFWTKGAKNSFLELGGKLIGTLYSTPIKRGYLDNAMHLPPKEWVMFKETFRTGSLIIQSDKLVITKARDVSDSDDSVSAEGYGLELPEGTGTAIITALVLAGIPSIKINL